MEYKENGHLNKKLKVDNFQELEGSVRATHELVAGKESRLSAEQQEQVRQLAQSIDIKDSQYVISYGSTTQKDISNFADKVLSEVTTKDSGEVGHALSELMFRVKEMDVESLSNKKGMISKLPVIGSLFDKAKRFIVQYEKVGTQIHRIVKQLESAQNVLVADVKMLDDLYAKNRAFYDELAIYIEAGEIKLKELTEVEIPKLRALAQQSEDPALVQELNDMSQLAERFDKKIHDLKLSQHLTLQTAPQIRLIQSNNQVLAEKIQSSVLNTIPMWKNQIVIAISLYRQEKAAVIQKDVTDTTNDLLQKNSEMMKQNSINIARENEKGIVEIDTLRKMHTDLIATLEETMNIQEEGKKKRLEAEKELLNMEKEMKEKMIELSQRKSQF